LGKYDSTLTGTATGVQGEISFIKWTQQEHMNNFCVYLMAEEEPVPKTILGFSKNKKIRTVSELRSMQLK
jgi:hypothetical protein